MALLINDKTQHINMDWALLLEENEILGKSMTYTEREIALNTHVINNYTNNFYTDVKDIGIQQGNDG